MLQRQQQQQEVSLISGRYRLAVELAIGVLRYEYAFSQRMDYFFIEPFEFYTPIGSW